MTKPMRVLLVEDNPGDADLIREMLPSTPDSGFSIHCVTKMAEAVSCLAEQEVDLTLLDLNLPDSQGLETVYCVRRAAPNTPIVVLTGHDDEKVGNEAVRSGAQDFLVKGKTPAHHLSRVLRYAVQRQRAEERLRESERFLRLTLDSLSAHIAIVDASGRILAVNRAWKDFARLNGESGMRSCEATNYLDACKHTQYKEEDEAAHAKAFAEGVDTVLNGVCPFFEMVYTLTGAEGKYWFLGQVTPFPGDGDRRVVIAHENITARRQAEEEKIELAARLRHAYKMEAIGTLAGGIAHDFNNILSSVLGYTELCLMDIKPDSPIEKNLQEVYRAGLRAKELVQQILTFARKDEGRVQPTKVSAIAQETCKLIRSALPACIDIQLKIESDACVLAEPVQIHQIFMNLFANAAQAMEQGGGRLSVWIAETTLDRSFNKVHNVFKPGNYLKIVISDTGTGISKEKIDRIFDPYYTTKGRTEGTGLGLSVVHGIVKSYGGEITVRSQMNKGSAFSVYLPLMEHQPVTEKSSPKKLLLGRERILFVDDEESIIQMNQKRLTLLGYRVTTLNNSLQALEQFAAAPQDFDLLITDMTMPMMSGDQLALKIKQIRPDIPIILCTGYSKKISTASAAAIGVNAILMKPVAINELAATIRRLFDKNKVA